MTSRYKEGLKNFLESRDYELTTVERKAQNGYTVEEEAVRMYDEDGEKVVRLETLYDQFNPERDHSWAECLEEIEEVGRPDNHLE